MNVEESGMRTCKPAAEGGVPSKACADSSGLHRPAIGADGMAVAQQIPYSSQRCRAERHDDE